MIAIIVCIDGFKKAVWKGLLCLCCFPYTLYYGFTEFEHPKKDALMWTYVALLIASFVFRALGGFESPFAK